MSANAVDSESQNGTTEPQLVTDHADLIPEESKDNATQLEGEPVTDADTKIDKPINQSIQSDVVPVTIEDSETMGTIDWSIQSNSVPLTDTDPELDESSAQSLRSNGRSDLPI
ncbi:hypothetical protein Acr_14g0000180 [Actinidia rufa]|uniref:Uncharacterized protein n=1 Tax=Actinidia rufa TaxID=165716 RepID=A0A7J0FNU2_9ERIC|nr:hypothetical protein Acr_14g0000180 [Actinidia rufa]